MSPASCGRRAVRSLLSLSCLAYCKSCLVLPMLLLASSGLVSPAEANGVRLGNSSGSVHMAAPPRAVPPGQPPRQPPSFGPHHSRNLPATFRPNATWPQQHFRHKPHLAAFPAQVIYAPQILSDESLPAGYYSDPDIYTDAVQEESPPVFCTGPLIIHIGEGARQTSNADVRVIHAQPSLCAAPRTVRYAGPRIIDTGLVPSGEPRKPAK